MSNAAPLAESAHGYLSERSKKRFTVVTGVLGFVFFLAQFILPMLIIFLFMFPTMMLHEYKQADLEQATLWQGDLWFIEETVKMSLNTPSKVQMTRQLKHARLSNLDEASESIRLEKIDEPFKPALLPQGDRLWLITSSEVSYCEKGAVTVLHCSGEPNLTSCPFLYQGCPAFITYSHSLQLKALQIDGTDAHWRDEPSGFNSSLPQGGSVCRLDVVQVGERFYLVAEVRPGEARHSSLQFREMNQSEWHALVTDEDYRTTWASMALNDQLALVLIQKGNDEQARLSIVTVADPGGIKRQKLVELDGRYWQNSRAFPSGARLILFTETMFGSRKLLEIADGKIVRSVRTKSSFPFGNNMMAIMFAPQLLPFVLAMALAFVLTVQMRKHRVQKYVAHGVTRIFATLWQRAWAQAIDALVLGAGMLISFGWMWRAFSDPESLFENNGPLFPLLFFAVFALSFVWMLLVLVAFSYFEGRFGKTPGKLLLGIRVLGTDLNPCGFWRALVRNVLTFVDGFFNFLIGILLVALTENWQRLGDLAARTLVVIDEKETKPSVTAPIEGV